MGLKIARHLVILTWIEINSIPGFGSATHSLSIFCFYQQFSKIPLSGLTQHAELKAEIEAVENAMTGESVTVSVASQTLADRIDDRVRFSFIAGGKRKLHSTT